MEIFLIVFVLIITISIGLPIYFAKKDEKKQKQQDEENKANELKQYNERFQNGRIIKYTDEEKYCLNFWKNKYGSSEKMYKSYPYKLQYNGWALFYREMNFFDEARVFFYDLNLNAGISYERIESFYTESDDNYYYVRLIITDANAPLNFLYIKDRIREAEAFKKKITEIIEGNKNVKIQH